MSDIWDEHQHDERVTTRNGAAGPNGTRGAWPFDTPPTTAPVTREMPVAAVPVAPVTPIDPTAGVAPVVAVESPAVVEQQTHASHWRISPAAIMAGAAAIVLMLWGAVVVARAGTDAPLGEPIVEVAGYAATAILGCIVLGGGAMLLIAAFTRSRPAIAFVSIVLGIAAAALAIEPGWGQDALATERDGAIAALVLLVITAGVALVAPDVERVSRRRDEWRA